MLVSRMQELARAGGWTARQCPESRLGASGANRTAGGGIHVCCAIRWADALTFAGNPDAPGVRELAAGSSRPTHVSASYRGGGAD